MNEITMNLNADHLIRQALQEDITSQDITTNAVMREKKAGEVQLICKQEGVIAGLAVFERVFQLLVSDTQVEFYVKDGDKVLKEGTDYTLSYVYGEDAETKDFAGAEFVKEGNYTITVTGIGNYEGSTGKAVFTISKNNSASTDPTNPSNPNGDKKVTDKKVSNNTNNVKPVVKNVAAKNNKNVPKTGDNANVLLWIALAVISCGVLAGAGVAVRKRK